MTADELETQLRLGEDAVAEFKSVLLHEKQRMDPRDLAKAIVAMANTRGGHIFIGVEDDGTVTGAGTLEQVDLLMRQASQVCQNNIHPPPVLRHPEGGGAGTNRPGGGSAACASG